MTVREDDVLGRGVVASGTGCEGVIRRASAIEDVFTLLRHPELAETILLTDSATATALVPLLPKVRGLICTSGGITSHLAIVAREFGLSCVMAAVVDHAGGLEGIRVVIDPDGGITRA